MKNGYKFVGFHMISLMSKCYLFRFSQKAQHLSIYSFNRAPRKLYIFLINIELIHRRFSVAVHIPRNAVITSLF